MAVVRVEVTAEDLARGRRFSLHAGPVALAVYRACDLASLCSRVAIEVFGPPGPDGSPARCQRPTPPELARWLAAFNRHGPAVGPAPAFALELPDSFVPR